MDEIVAIEVRGLKPKQPITLRTYFHDEDKQFESFAHYTSNDEGKVNTMHQPSEGGNFIGNTRLTVPCFYFQRHVMKGTVFQPRVLELNLHNMTRLPHSKYHDRKKSGNVPARLSYTLGWKTVPFIFTSYIQLAFVRSNRSPVCLMSEKLRSTGSKIVSTCVYMFLYRMHGPISYFKDMLLYR